MTEKRNNFYSDNPAIVLNGLITDKNKYSYEQKCQFLNKKKKLDEKKIEKEDSPPKTRRKIAIKKTKLNNDNIITLSEDSDSNDSHKIKYPKKINNKNKLFINKNKIKISFNEEISTSESKKRKNENKLKKNKIKSQREPKRKNIKKKNKNVNNKNKNEIISDIIMEDDDVSEEIIEENDNKSISLLNNKNDSNNQFINNINYKNVEKSNNYDDIKNKCKNESCTYISLYSPNELKSIIELNSSVLQLFKKIKNEEQDNIIISNQKQERNLINALNGLLTKRKDNTDNKYEIFKKLNPEYNNILSYLPSDYYGINKYGFMNINSYYNEDKILFITPLFKDRTDKYILRFRKYILNLSSFKSNLFNNNDYDSNIYHIIIPKNNIKNIDINFNVEMNLCSLIEKLDCKYYFYIQKPGELLIVEPGSLHLSYYKKSKNYEKQDKNYLLMFWNKLNIDSLHDYMILKDDCKNERYKSFPILTMLLNLINKKIKSLSSYYIQTIREIYNEMDLYENINNYINDINDNNISLHKLYLNNIDLCCNCQQEIFNYYFYYNDKKENKNTLDKNNCFLCINCGYKKKYFSIPNSILFFKYQKDELESFLSFMSSNINRIKIEKEEEKINNEEDIISKCFDFNNREDDSINIDNFILNLNGPLNIIDKDYHNNNYHLMNKIKVDKYLLFLENDKMNNLIDPLNKSNFTNNLNEKDIYGELKSSEGFSMKNNSMSENSHNKSVISNINKIELEINNNNFLDQRSLNNNINNSYEIKNSFINRENNNSKKKKKKGTTMSDLIADGIF